VTETAGQGQGDPPADRQVPHDDAEGFLTQLPEDGRRALLSRARPVEVAAGGWLFRQGEPGDAMYVLTSGSLDVVLEEPAPATVLRTLQRGSTLGEIAMLTASPRSASVRARRDSNLLRVAHNDLAALLGEHPSFALALSTALGRQLQQGPPKTAFRRQAPGVITIVPAHRGAEVEQVRDALHLALGLSGSACWLDARRADEGPYRGAGKRAPAYGELLDRHERDHDHVLLMAETVVGSSDWDRFCLRQADRLVAVAHSDHPPAESEARSPLLGCDLVFVDRQPRAADIGEWLALVQPRTWHQAGSNPELARAVRRLTGRSVGAVLSGGGARGLAHIGALEVLAESGIEVDRVGGCSMGSFLGALHATGCDAKEMEQVCRRELVARNSFNDYTVPLVSLIRARKAEAMLRRVFGDHTIEELSRPFFCVSADLLSGQTVRHDRGPLWRAVGASMSLPGLCPPVDVDGQLLVDGGVLNNLPIDLMPAAEGPVIAVDVMVRELRGRMRSDRSRMSYLRLGRRRVSPSDKPLPHIVETLARSTVLGSCGLAEENRQLADLVISPEVSGIPMFGFDQLDAAVAAGRAATQKALRDQTYSVESAAFFPSKRTSGEA
jgi:predicted acylesterase/phospholipase RssA/CRP-like cAMP-binding protein